MANLIIIRGPLGIGKTTIAKKVTEKIQAKYYSIDTLLEEHKLDIIDWDLGCIPVNNFIKINKFIVPSIIKELENNNSVVIDGNFYHKEQLNNLLEKLAKYPFIVFTLDANLNTCIQRDAARENSHGLEATKAVYKLVNSFKTGITILNEDSNIDEKVSLIISKLK